MRAYNRPALIAATAFLWMAGGSAWAASSPVTGLGQAWPNAADHSSSSHFHVYVFEKQGVRYVQVNDNAGTVRGAVALVGGEALDLPIGIDADQWQAVPEGTVAQSGEPVYRDDAVTISVAPQQDGSARLLMAPGECTDPAKCSKRDN